MNRKPYSQVSKTSITLDLVPPRSEITWWEDSSQRSGMQPLALCSPDLCRSLLSMEGCHWLKYSQQSRCYLLGKHLLGCLLPCMGGEPILRLSHMIKRQSMDKWHLVWGSKMLRSDREICTFSTVGPAFASLLIDTTPISLSNIRHDASQCWSSNPRLGVGYACLARCHLPQERGDVERNRRKAPNLCGYLGRRHAVRASKRSLKTLK